MNDGDLWIERISSGNDTRVIRNERSIEECLDDYAHGCGTYSYGETISHQWYGIKDGQVQTIEGKTLGEAIEESGYQRVVKIEDWIVDNRESRDIHIYDVPSTYTNAKEGKA